ncbi:MAG: hypothetical protein Q3974_00805 [Rothia sp. (in: high G+C Gram-positive bacteria)]|nr:hypothetical protein [Rothia sp. (in: high G+C Gram-positive bacteria)]
MAIRQEDTNHLNDTVNNNGNLNNGIADSNQHMHDSQVTDGAQRVGDGVNNHGAPVAPQYSENQHGHMNHQYGTGHDPLMHEEGIKAANSSKIMGAIALVISILSLFFPPASILSLILGFIGMSRAKKAKRFGAKAGAGKIMSILAIIISLLVILLWIIAAIFLANNPDFQDMVRQYQPNN